MEKNNSLRNELIQMAYGAGAVLFGAADIRALKKEFYFSDEILNGLDYAIAIAVRLSDAILEEIIDAPTKIYYHHYRQANIALDRIAFNLSNFIHSKGYRALPVPASQIIDWKKQKGHLSHKKIANLAGLGFIGRNNLLVNPELGARFRLVTILTNIPLVLSSQQKRRNGSDGKIYCGTCRACINVCPAGAIKEEPKDFDHIRCYEKVREFRNRHIVDQFICGICVKACRGG